MDTVSCGVRAVAWLLDSSQREHGALLWSATETRVRRSSARTNGGLRHVEPNRMSVETHRWVTRRDWHLGEARCHNCRRSVDIGADFLWLRSMSRGTEEIVVFDCPRCRQATHFHIDADGAG